jgi:hypothetical protein
MKKIYALFISMMLFVCTAQVSAQGTIPPESEIKDMLCHNWKYSSMQSGSQKLPLSGLLPSSIRFNHDGTLIRIDRYDDTTTGTWSFEYKSLTLKTEDKTGKEKNKLVRIDQNTMMIRNKFAGVYTDYFLTRID